MTDSVALGVNGLSIPAGTHICAFFRGVAERDEIMVPFLREGLSTGDKCLCIIDDGVEGVHAALDVDAESSANSERRRLEIRSSKETYLRHGAFSTQAMLDFWHDSVGTAL